MPTLFCSIFKILTSDKKQRKNVVEIFIFWYVCVFLIFSSALENYLENFSTKVTSQSDVVVLKNFYYISFILVRKIKKKNVWKKLHKPLEAKIFIYIEFLQDFVLTAISIKCNQSAHKISFHNFHMVQRKIEKMKILKSEKIVHHFHFFIFVVNVCKNGDPDLQKCTYKIQQMHITKFFDEKNENT